MIIILIADIIIIIIIIFTILKEYANPVEVLLSNVAPSVGGAVLFGGVLCYYN